MTGDPELNSIHTDIKTGQLYEIIFSELYL